ncbi:MAG: 23S rRNA (adenine(2503)-C(2))-methyltransferase RlmN [Bifidobacteriaceae bacterium]|jgi:23S rRNA (adenine2503-C2)-methyltransferase|nr:23S rRNA (adenine(2503)-C(2))-methyltransferase RlmN [Bifidobacteriaceae bacterium]
MSQADSPARRDGVGRPGPAPEAAFAAKGADGLGVSAPAVATAAHRTRAAKPPPHLADLAPEERDAWAESLGLPRMRARQAARHYFSRLERSASYMTDLPAAGRDQLVATLLPELLTEVARQTTDRGRTVKTLYRLCDSSAVETVLMAYPGRVTLCVSSQAGCGMACPFCATGKLGLKRNLTAAEMLEQVRLAARAAGAGALGEPARLSNVVFMGMGEPLANYRALERTLRGIAGGQAEGFGISARNVTVSTCGLIPGIDRLAGEGLPVRLALSLHAPDDETRDRLVPVNRRYGVAATLAAAHRYHLATGRRVSIEYALIRDINDQAWRASQLAERLCQYGTRWVHVNPIPLNPVEGSVWAASRPEAQDAFVRRLAQAGLTVTLRDTRGRDIDGACGQLAAKEVAK